jgi:peptidoglycan/LPS O-acetylase OafA/YrhL
MELVLNVAWGLLAGVMFCLWLRFRSREGVDRRGQILALAVLLLILFPVISLTDDLPHTILPVVAALPVSRLAEISFSVQRTVAPGSLDSPIFDLPALTPIQNQPPPPAA